MTLDVVNAENQKVGSLDLDDAVFAGPVKTDLIWESVVRANAPKRRGTHMTKTRGRVSGTGREPRKQKGTGRPQVGEARHPLWRKGGTVFGPQPRSYAYALPKKVERGALRAALISRLREGAITVVDELRCAEIKTKTAVALLERLGAEGRTLVIDLAPDENFTRSARNIPGVTVAPSGRIHARDVMDARRIIATRAAIERLQEVLG
jgi:large subunit ribosomal protein L4